MIDSQIFTNFEVEELIGGKKINFDDFFIGKNFYLLNIWSSWCEPCKDEIEYLLELKNDNEILMIGINYKDKKKNALNFLKLYGDPFEKIVIDKQGKIVFLTRLFEEEEYNQMIEVIKSIL